MRKVVSVLSVLLLLVIAIVGASTANAANSPASSGSTATSMSRTPVSAEDGERIARDFLLTNASRYGVTPADLQELRVDKNYASDASGARYVAFAQTVNGIGLFNGSINVTILPNGNVLFVGNRAVANLAAKATVTEPTISQADAIAAAAEALGLSYTASSVTQAISVAGTDRAATFSGGDLSLTPIPVRLEYQSTAAGDLVLAWSFDIYQQDAQHHWAVRVDATTGALVDKNDWVVHENFDDAIEAARANGTLNSAAGAAENRGFVGDYVPAAGGDGSSYKVYPIPVESPQHTTPLPPADGRVVVNQPADSVASPFGWHDTNGADGAEFTTTQGNNAHAYTDVDNNNSPDAGSSPDGGAGLDFAPPIDLTAAPSTYRPAAVVNLFYWNNLMHDIPYIHGFNEVAGNFQENNYGIGGAGSDYVFAEAQDGSGTNNANFDTPPDGTNPRMQMYVFTLTSPQRDGDLDSGIIAHEYGHGISNRLTGNSVNCLNNAEQMGEGWSDWQSVTLTARKTDTRTTNRGMGTYVLGQPVTGVGVRGFPYNTDMSVDPRTYQNTRTAAVPHGVGSIWTAILWEVYWNLVDEYGFNPDLHGGWTTGGNNLAYKLVQDGMAIQPCSPGFVDGRDAIIAADEALTGGENFCLLWTGFAKRGLGTDAVQGSSNTNSDNTNGFLVPAECGGPTPTPTATSANPDINVAPTAVAETHNGPQTTNENLTIGNTGGATLEWTITEDAGTIVVGQGGAYEPGTVGNAPAAQGNNGLTNSGQSGAPYRHTLAPSAGSTTVTHSSTQDIETGNSVSCNSGGLHTDNSYYRVFDLAGDFGINDAFTVNEVSFGVEQATGATGSQPVSVILYTLSGPFVLANLTEIGQEDVQVADTAGTIETVTFSPAVVVPANSVLVAEIFTPNGQTAGNSFFIGSNTAAQTDPSYLRATDCGVSQPTDTAAIGFPDMHIVLNVTGDVGGGGGTCSAPSDIPWLTVSPTNGSTSAGGSSNVTLTFNSTTLSTGTYTGTLCIESNDPNEALVTVPVTLSVEAPTAVSLGSLTPSASGIRIADVVAAGVLLLAGVILVLRRK